MLARSLQAGRLRSNPFYKLLAKRYHLRFYAPLEMREKLREKDDTKQS